ncbi:hypothetical protein EWB00_003059 [Schistosoma japonicum]|uniref:Uncharacterized protein n=1 Tax=Schistosoma japonicum TaxID=6182 RepID=A0A4Z2DAN3_SCHJA|nr:hypothetical protein EWB00_003059 [Schistosoma japonicum]
MSAGYSENLPSDNDIVESSHSLIDESASIQQSTSLHLEDKAPSETQTPFPLNSSSTLQLTTKAQTTTQTETKHLQETQLDQQEFTEEADTDKLQQCVGLNSSDNYSSNEPSPNIVNSDNIMTRRDDIENMSPNWIPEQHYNIYSCSAMTPSSQSVFQLKQYYTNLEESTKPNGTKLTETNNDKNDHVERSLHKLRRNTFDRTLCQSDSKNNKEHFDDAEDFSPYKNDKIRTSVEELRKLFESGSFNNRKKSQTVGEILVTLVEQNEQANNLSRSKSFEPIKPLPKNPTEFHSRPPKFRTPSPKPFNLPTPPPLPLPPSMEFINKSYEIANVTYNNIENASEPKNKMGCRNKNYSSCWSQPAKPILSMSLPYRSRSLALDKKADLDYGNRQSSFTRYRACSITQRSLSPLPNTSSFKDDQINKSVKRTSTKSSDAKYWKLNKVINSDSNNTKNAVHEKQKPNQSIVRYDESGVKPDQIVCVNPSSTDGMYVRSAVVYERINEKPFSIEPKNFITTYVVSKWPSPSQATVQATNLWVAEQTLQQYNQRSSTPFRTRAISNLKNTDQPTETRDIQFYHSPVDNAPKLKKTTKHQKDKTLTVHPRIKFDQNDHTRTFTHTNNKSLSPQPLPTPPPTGLHPHILRCTSGECSPSHQSRISQPFMKKFSYIDKGRHSPYYKPYLSRSWSVKSLSPPPPFRSQWLSSMSTSRSRQKIFDKSYSLTCDPYHKSNVELSCKGHKSREPNRVINCTKHRSCIESYHMENARRLRNREKTKWIKRAEEISEDRQKYHELRGSWSPPLMRSPPRETPNNMEERTEKEIRKYIRQHSPPSRSPRVAFPRHSSYYPQEYVKSLDKGIQCDTVGGDGGEHQITKLFVNDCIDTTPIAEDFDKKRAYFEELIKTNKNIAQCSFCSDCYHCSPSQTPKLSAYSSWDSEINHLNSQNNLFLKRDCYTKDQPDRYHNLRHEQVNQEYHSKKQYQQKISNYYNHSQNVDYNPQECIHNRYPGAKYHNNIHSSNNNNPHFTLDEPEQYTSNTNLRFENPALEERDTNYTYLNNQFMDQPSNFTKHDYYAKGVNAMPKVAPNPPTNSNYNNNNDFYSYNEPYDSFVKYRNISPLRVELEDSPYNNQYTTQQPYKIQKTIHSPPCRFSAYTKNDNYDLPRYQHNQQHGESLESLHCEQNDYANDQPKFYGRVKQIVQALDKQAAEFNSRIDSVESVTSPNRHRPLRRSHSDRFSYLMPRTSW